MQWTPTQGLTPAGQRAVELVPELCQRRRRAFSESGERGAGAKIVGGIVAPCHRCANAGRRRPVAGVSENDQEHPDGSSRRHARKPILVFNDAW